MIAAVIAGMTATHGASLKFNGTTQQVWSEKPTAATGLEEIYVINNMTGVTATYTAGGPATGVTVTRWGAQGAVDPQPVAESELRREGRSVTVSGLTSDRGYAFTEGNRTVYYWLIDYDRHRYVAESLVAADEQDCDRIRLMFRGNASPITYHGINGRSWTLDRGLELRWSTLAFDRDNFAFVTADKVETLASIGTSVSVDAPLCDTYFTLSGDRFMRYWGEESEISTPRFTSFTPAAEIKVEQEGEKADNQVSVDTDGLGGSAPVTIDFAAAINDASVFHEWQFSHDEEFSDITMRTQQLEFTQTFTEMGTTYARFIAANAAGTCFSESEVVKVYIGESFLRCPNVFSPGATEGVNDEWKVSYKSIVTFECYIFNKWGQKLAEFHDPAMGWDGRHNGKPVGAGVYYYVIKATGSDGKNYNLSGDINIVGYTGE